MIEKHTTKEGDEMMISQMEDSHLINFISMRIEKLNNMKKLLSSNDIAVTGFQQALYDIDIKAAAKTAKVAVRKITKLLYPYIAEAGVRGLLYKGSDLLNILQIGYDRIGKDEKLTDVMAKYSNAWGNPCKQIVCDTPGLGNSMDDLNDHQ